MLVNVKGRIITIRDSPRLENTEFNLNGINIGTLKYSVKCTSMEPKT